MELTVTLRPEIERPPFRSLGTRAAGVRQAIFKDDSTLPAISCEVGYHMPAHLVYYVKPVETRHAYVELPLG